MKLYIPPLLIYFKLVVGLRILLEVIKGRLVITFEELVDYFYVTEEFMMEKFKFIADGYSAYPLAAQQFALKDHDPLSFDITQVIGLTNDDAVSTEFRPFKQMVERLNRTFKVTYRCSCGYDNFEGANYAVSLWVAYYNFLRPHSAKNFNVLNSVDMIQNAENMPGKWQILLHLGQQTILQFQEEAS